MINPNLRFPLLYANTSTSNQSSFSSQESIFPENLGNQFSNLPGVNSISANSAGFANEAIHQISAEVKSNLGKRKHSERASLKEPLPLLHQAVLQKDKEKVQRLIQSEFFIDEKDHKGRTPLFFAVVIQDLALTEILLKNRADVQGAGIVPSLIHRTVDTGNVGITNLLIEYGALLESGDHYDATPLHYAARRGHGQIVAILLHRNASKNATDFNNKTPLHWAAIYGHEKIICQLMTRHYFHPENDQNEILDNRDENGMTPLHLAVRHGNTKAVEMLLYYNAKVNIADKEGNTPLHEAINTENPMICKLLLNKQADINAKNHLGYTPLHLTAKFRSFEHTSNNLQTAKILCDAGANLEAVNEKYDWATPLLDAARYGNDQVFKYLISVNANIHALTIERKSAFHLASERMLQHEDEFELSNSYCIIFKTLLLSNIDLTQSDEENRNILDKIAEWDSYSIAKFFNQVNAEEIEKILKNYRFFQDLINNNFQDLLISDIPSLYVCLAFFSPTFKQHMGKLSTYLNDEQLYNLLVCQNEYSSDYLAFFQTLPPQVLCHIAQWLCDESLDQIKKSIEQNLHPLIDSSILDKLEDKLKSIISEPEEPSFEEENVLLSIQLTKIVMSLTPWITNNDQIALLEISFHEKICSVYKKVLKFFNQLVDFQRKHNKNIFIEEKSDVFAYLYGLGLVSTDDYKKELDCLQSRFYPYGIFNLEDLTVLGIGNDLEKIIQEIKTTKNPNELGSWKQENVKNIQSIVDLIRTNFPVECKQLIYFLELLEASCQELTDEMLELLNRADQARRIVCLKAYLAQDGVEKVLNNNFKTPEYSLSEWAENHPQLKIADFYELEKHLSSTASKEPCASTSSQK